MIDFNVVLLDLKNSDISKGTKMKLFINTYMYILMNRYYILYAIYNINKYINKPNKPSLWSKFFKLTFPTSLNISITR